MKLEGGLFSGKSVLITGASRGLGRQLTQAFWSQGADLLLVARSADGLEALRASLPGGDRPPQRAVCVPADLAAADAPARIFEALNGFTGRLDALINNAAIVGPIGPLEENDWGFWQFTIQVNLLAPAALCRLAIPIMKAQGAGAIVNLSGGGATSPRPRFSAYAAAKAGLVRLTETIAAEAGCFGIRANAIAPGAMNTEMLDAVLRAGPAAAGAEYGKAVEQQQRGGASPATAAELAVFLASERAVEINGRLLSAVWDPWEKIAAYAEQLGPSDIYTLRRIVPEDRGVKWE